MGLRKPMVTYRDDNCKWVMCRGDSVESSRNVYWVRIGNQTLFKHFCPSYPAEALERVQKLLVKFVEGFQHAVFEAALQ